ncbi:hypothetical protein AMATHDRAFT_149622 [Amanita thiersii Skay4041]|uniref:BTB domain-containing protein n=1 Tax=Amanita thiersii Skay4041 TaxID=703135 RepID=A0A2A9NC10_9AGAR|nr:hypothetical protein AMATHDRAFT_149622 [Amanita thiersii Skay4041]
MNFNANTAELQERAEIIELILHYMHNTPQPQLDDVSYQVLQDLAKVAEKYLTYSAMEICRSFIE